MSVEEDDASAEGNVFQTMFDDDSDTSDDGDVHPNAALTVSGEDAVEVFVTRNILHVQVEEQQVGGSIAHRLWPPAEALATFVIDCAQGREVALSTPRPAKGRSTIGQTPQAIVETLQDILRQSCPIIELGAGIGLTGLEIATQLNSPVLLTELEEGLPLLHRNQHINAHSFRRGDNAVEVKKLRWGDDQDCQEALSWYHGVMDSNVGESEPKPLLLLGSDCVYWEEIHKPLELALAGLLSQSPPNSMCLLAGIRRWKRDNTFYQTLGKHTRTATHELQCTLLQETVNRDEADSRVVQRIYAVQWVSTDK